MSRLMRNTLGFSMGILMLFSLLAQTAGAASPAAMKAVKDARNSADAASEDPLKDLSDTEIDALLGRLIEAKIQKTVDQKAPPVPETAEAPAPKRRVLVKIFRQAEGVMSSLNTRLDAFLSGTLASPDELPRLAHRLTGGRGVSAILMMSMGVLLLIFSGAVAEWLFHRWTAGMRQTLANAPPSGHVRKAWRIMLNLSLEIAGALIFILSTFLVYILFYEKTGTTRLFTVVYLLGAYYVRLIILILVFILSPKNPILRFFPVSDAGARYLFRWTVFIAVTAIFLGVTSSLFELVDPGAHVHLILYNLAGLSVVVLAAVMVIRRREPIAAAIRENYFSAEEEPSALQERLVKHWYIPVLFFLVCIALFWEIGMLSGAENLVNRLILSFLSVPVFLLLNYGCQRLFRIAFVRVASTIDLSEPPGETEEGEPRKDLPAVDFPSEESLAIGRYIPLIRKGFHVLLVALFLFLMLRLWGIDWPFGREVTRSLFSSLLILLLGYGTWEFAKAWIDRKIKEEMPAGHDEMDDEGGAGGSRSGTLLLLLRKFILMVLVVFVGLTILSSLGVNIGPLIAGAGIFGLAIGFGAQTLVKDIISGIFFLMDDAFRIGDYVESGSMKGTVEQISLRSMRLRHPRGMINTIPFGDLSSVTNFSRDYIITKLNFQVRYDTDVDQVRKIIKKIDEEIRKDPEIGKSLLSKIKSQGVKSLDDSAMVMRVKFKSIPGEQFIIQREVYRLLQEKFRKAGIEFAHRNVTVYFPPEMTQGGGTPASGGKSTAPGGVDPYLAQAASAAAMKVLQDEEEELAKLAEEASKKKK
ncbi:mechanosensitive ion channel family protein [Desulfococcus sp.]|uniref:mechanosensitive ion channel family protein n=1 Tax=Desulfococcus sp. TaxID=2025834 RepID=UPI0035941E9B